MFKKLVIVDLRGHLLGRAAAVVAKELLCGQRVVCVRAELAEIAGPLYRNKVKFQWFVNKRVNTNPRRGPFHHKSPAKMFWRAVRGMLPHKTPRGAEALKRLRVYNGVPAPYDTKKRVVIPVALRALHLAPERKFTVLGVLAEQCGWTRRAVLERLEAKRKLRSAIAYNQKKKIIATRAKISFVFSLSFFPPSPFLSVGDDKNVTNFLLSETNTHNVDAYMHHPLRQPLSFSLSLFSFSTHPDRFFFKHTQEDDLRKGPGCCEVEAHPRAVRLLNCPPVRLHLQLSSPLHFPPTSLSKNARSLHHQRES